MGNDLDVKYFHLRTYNNDGSVHNKGGMTIAWQVQVDNSIKVSKAICSLEDNFCKIDGRNLALSRLISGNTETISKATLDEYVSHIIFPYVSSRYSKNLTKKLTVHDMSLSFIQNVIVSESVSAFV